MITFDTAEKNWKIYVTLQLWKKSGEKWKTKSIILVKRVNVADDGSSVEDHFSGIKRKKVVMLK
jgi:hypothetical protein